MIFRVILLSLLGGFPVLAVASWFDRISDLVDIKPSPLAPSTLKLIPAPQVDPSLPANWQTYWLDEPVFKSRIFIAQAGAKDAPVILLVHGLGQNGLRDWLPIVSNLARSYRVVMLDLPGFGLSEVPKAKLSPTHYAQMLHAIRGLFSEKPIIVVGHSMGAAVTLRYAERFPDDILQIALIDVAGILQRTAFVKHSALDRISVDEQQLSGSLLRYVSNFQDFSGALVEKLAGLPDPTAWLGKNEMAWGAAFGKYPNVNAALSLVEEDFSRAIYALKLPVFMLWGAKDQVAPIRTGEMLANIFDDTALAVIPDAGHNPMATHGDMVANWLLQSLSAVSIDSESNAVAINRSKSQGDYVCRSQSGRRISGRYTRIDIENCTKMVMEGVDVDQLTIENSIVSIDKSRLNAVIATESVVVMTGGSVSAPMRLSGVRLDIAGVSFERVVPFDVATSSRVIASICRAGDGRYLHSDTNLENQVW